jgi:arylsulfatase A-like enzyme
MKITPLYALITLLLIQGGYHLQAQQNTRITGPAKKPNIIFFLVDDMGWQDCSVPFYKDTTALNKTYRTPNMERLAAMGVKFTNAYANCVCTPSRVSLQTGMNAARHRVTNWTFYTKDHPTDEPYNGITFPAWNYNGLSPVADSPHTLYATPIANILRQNGYRTIHVGKSHMASFPTLGANPINLGFDVNIAGSAIGGPNSYLGTENFGNDSKAGGRAGIPGLEMYHGKDIFLSEALTLEAKKALDTARLLQKPFYLYMNHYAVHAKYKADTRFYQHYINQRLSTEEAMYASLIEGMDKSLGDLMDYLEKYNMIKNTIIIFMSDNGGLSLVPPRSGKPFTHNLPLKSGKGSAYEGGTREPMMVYWPGITRPKTTNSQYVMIEDFFPTILQMAGVKNFQTVQTVDGKSMVPYLKDNNKRDTNRAIIWHFPNNWEEGARKAKQYKMVAENEGMGPYSAIRVGNWKLIYFYGIGKTELYNLNDDIGEQNNLVQRYPNKAKAMVEQLVTMLKKENAQFPTNTKTGELMYPQVVKSSTE